MRLLSHYSYILCQFPPPTQICLCLLVVCRGGGVVEGSVVVSAGCVVHVDVQGEWVMLHLKITRAQCWNHHIHFHLQLLYNASPGSMHIPNLCLVFIYHLTLAVAILGPRFSILDFVSQLWRKIEISFQNCETNLERKA